MNQPIYVPLQSLDDWKRLLAKPELHWKDDFSAKLTANSWHDATGFPDALREAFRVAGEPFASLAPLLIIPEHQVALPPSGARPAQPDVWVLASHAKGLASISVESKVKESFGPTMAEWQVKASPGKRVRLAFLKELLGLSGDLPPKLRYQLLHRTASAIIEAKRFHANTAVCVIQSFHPEHVGFEDFQAFAGLFGQTVERGRFVPLFEREGLTAYLGWVHHPSGSI